MALFRTRHVQLIDSLIITHRGATANGGCGRGLLAVGSRLRHCRGEPRVWGPWFSSYTWAFPLVIVQKPHSFAFAEHALPMLALLLRPAHHDVGDMVATQRICSLTDSPCTLNAV